MLPERGRNSDFDMTRTRRFSALHRQARLAALAALVIASCFDTTAAHGYGRGGGGGAFSSASAGGFATAGVGIGGDVSEGNINGNPFLYALNKRHAANAVVTKDVNYDGIADGVTGLVGGILQSVGVIRNAAFGGYGGGGGGFGYGGGGGGIGYGAGGSKVGYGAGAGVGGAGTSAGAGVGAGTATGPGAAGIRGSLGPLQGGLSFDDMGGGLYGSIGGIGGGLHGLLGGGADGGAGGGIAKGGLYGNVGGIGGGLRGSVGGGGAGGSYGGGAGGGKAEGALYGSIGGVGGGLQGGVAGAGGAPGVGADIANGGAHGHVLVAGGPVEVPPAGAGGAVGAGSDTNVIAVIPKKRKPHSVGSYPACIGHACNRINKHDLKHGPYSGSGYLPPEGYFPVPAPWHPVTSPGLPPMNVPGYFQPGVNPVPECIGAACGDSFPGLYPPKKPGVIIELPNMSPPNIAIDKQFSFGAAGGVAGGYGNQGGYVDVQAPSGGVGTQRVPIGPGGTKHTNIGIGSGLISGGFEGINVAAGIGHESSQGEKGVAVNVGGGGGLISGGFEGVDGAGGAGGAAVVAGGHGLPGQPGQPADCTNGACAGKDIHSGGGLISTGGYGGVGAASNKNIVSASGGYGGAASGGYAHNNAYSNSYASSSAASWSGGYARGY